MKLTNSASAYIQPNKLTGYLLSKTHPIGKTKAKFFRGLGFDETNVELLERELLTIARAQAVYDIMETIHGKKYIIIGPIETPTGKTVTVLTVWIVDNGEDIPRFVTARPYK